MGLAGAGLAVAAVGVGGSILSANAQSDAIKSGQDQANAIARQTIATAQPLYQPFIDQGTAGLGAYADLTGVNGPDAATKAMSQFTASPGYQYQVSEGLKGVDAGAASRGMLTSGQTIKAEETLGSNLADQDFGNYMTRLNTLANFGSNAVSGFSNVLVGQGNQQQSTDTSAAGAQANIVGKEFSGITNSLTGLASTSGLGGSGGGGSSGIISNGSGSLDLSANRLAGFNQANP